MSSSNRLDVFGPVPMHSSVLAFGSWCMYIGIAEMRRASHGNGTSDFDTGFSEARESMHLGFWHMHQAKGSISSSCGLNCLGIHLAADAPLVGIPATDADVNSYSCLCRCIPLRRIALNPWENDPHLVHQARSSGFETRQKTFECDYVQQVQGGLNEW
ncbi:hypothetical protein C7974DRAFT_132057 [Boeremia exigua]|uniref:uncharacterized protein n=1 Tax=Boeremia exigua TaxID=749465 RepID=UPI001E8DD8A0|nr:uncharacterized protein C7974DRAFT_132057 [Boeremia exigua]KAH6639461.1 hypothetical protein C7974DRAFT_132057 [Boeremia exigua]